MKIEELSERVSTGGLFRTGQILSGRRQPANVRRQLDRWVKSGRIQQLRRGVYVLQKPYSASAVHPFAAANALKKASYVSLQSALAHYAMIPEYVPVVTSVTTGRPEELDTAIGRFIFRHVSSRYFWGFTETVVSPDQPVLMATPQKALIDLLYLTPHSDDEDYLKELRLERPEGFDLETLHSAAERHGSTKIKRAVQRLNREWEKTG